VAKTSEKTMPLMGHLAELRRRLTRSVIAVAITTALSFIFTKQIFDVLTFKAAFVKPAFDFLVTRFHLVAPPTMDNLVSLEITEMLGTYLKVSLIAGIILAVPYLIYEAVMFVSPALTPEQRRRFIYTAPSWVGLMFLIGVVFAYFVLLPPALGFLTTFGSDIVTLQFRIGNYISTVTRLLLAIGLVFELPVLTTFLAQIGIVSSKWLAGKRRIAAIGAFVVGAAITPTFDPINQTLVALPLFALYEMGIWLAKLVELRKRRTAAVKANVDAEAS